MIPTLKAKFTGSGVRLNSPAFTRDDNASLLEAGIESIKRRLSSALGPDDSPNRPLSRRYAQRKQRKYGRRPIRDMRLTGKTLDSLQVRYADDGRAVAEATVFSGEQARMLQFSPGDQASIDAKASAILGQKLSQISMRGRRTNFSRQTSFERS